MIRVPISWKAKMISLKIHEVQITSHSCDCIIISFNWNLSNPFIPYCQHTRSIQANNSISFSISHQHSLSHSLSFSHAEYMYPCTSFPVFLLLWFVSQLSLAFPLPSTLFLHLFTLDLDVFLLSFVMLSAHL